VILYLTEKNSSPGMAKLSKRARDLLKSSGKWPESRSERYSAGAAEFERLAFEHDPTPVPRPGAFAVVEPLQVYYPDVFSVADCAFASLEEVGSELEGFYNLGEECGEDERTDAFVKSFFMALAVRAVESSRGVEVSETFPLECATLPKKVYPIFTHFGSFDFGSMQCDIAEVEHFVRRCLRAVVVCHESGADAAVSTFPLPVTQADRSFMATISPVLREWVLRETGVSTSDYDYVRFAFSGVIPENLRGLSRTHPDMWESLRSYFFQMKDGPSVVKHILSGRNGELLETLGLVHPPGFGLGFEKSIRDFCKQISREGMVPSSSSFNSFSGCVSDWPDSRGSECQLVSRSDPLRESLLFKRPKGFTPEQELTGAVFSAKYGLFGRVFHLRMVDYQLEKETLDLVGPGAFVPRSSFE
jgi:hypothetical protein